MRQDIQDMRAPFVKSSMCPAIFRSVSQIKSVCFDLIVCPSPIDRRESCQPCTAARSYLKIIIEMESFSFCDRLELSVAYSTPRPQWSLWGETDARCRAVRPGLTPRLCTTTIMSGVETRLERGGSATLHPPSAASERKQQEGRDHSKVRSLLHQEFHAIRPANSTITTSANMGVKSRPV